MRRAVKLTLKFATQKKRRAIAALLEAYRGAVNFFIRSLWKTRGKLDKATLARLKNTRLSERYKSQALKQALETVVATKKAAKETKTKAGRPVFTGSAVLDAKFVSVEVGEGSFDLVVRLSTLKKGSRISIPTRGTRVLRKWLSKPGAKLIQGAALSENSLVVWIELPVQPLKPEGEVVGIDVGYHKLIASSEGYFLGTDFKQVAQKIRRKKPKSKAKGRALRERDQLVNYCVNRLPWDRISTLGIEDLIGLKKNRFKKGNKRRNRAMAPWSYRQVRSRIEQKAHENRVLLVPVDPKNTSLECPLCGAVSKENRAGPIFHCVRCGHLSDADYVGSVNVQRRAVEQAVFSRLVLVTPRSVESLGLGEASLERSDR
jgi:IS605 OrfB family transposase